MALLSARNLSNLFPTSVGINPCITIILLAPTTSCDGGVLLPTQGPHICLILSFILRGGRVAFINPNMRRDKVPWSITRMTHERPQRQKSPHGVNWKGDQRSIHTEVVAWNVKPRNCRRRILGLWRLGCYAQQSMPRCTVITLALDIHPMAKSLHVHVVQQYQSRTHKDTPTNSDTAP